MRNLTKVKQAILDCLGADQWWSLFFPEMYAEEIWIAQTQTVDTILYKVSKKKFKSTEILDALNELHKDGLIYRKESSVWPRH